MEYISLSRIICDFVVLLVTATPLLIFHEFVTPYKRGFYCDDESLYYPYKKSTVSRQVLIVVGILIPTMLILLTEVIRTLAWEKRISSEFGTYRCRKYNVHRLIVRLYVFIGYFFLGVCFNQLMVDIAKYTIGRQRPHFMDVCRPDPGFRNCLATEHKYIEEFNCTGNDKYLHIKNIIHEAQLSFYSGHAAFSFYAAWYTTFYLQARLFRPLYSKLILPVVQFALFGGAAFVAYSRVSDYKHHWSDVLVGTAMGSAIGIVNALFIAEVFERREIPFEFRKKARILGTMPIDRQSEEPLNTNNERSKFEVAEDGSDIHAPTRVIVHEERLPSIMQPARAEIASNYPRQQYTNNSDQSQQRQQHYR